MISFPAPVSSARLSYAAHARSLLVLGLPLIGSNLAQMSLHVTDTIMLGWYGVPELAAVVLGSSYFFILFILGSGFSYAVMGMVAQALGAGEEAQVRRDARMGLWLSILFGVAVMPLMWASGPILLALGQRPELAQLAQDYLRVGMWGMVPALIIAVLKSYLSAQERTQVVMWVTLWGVVLNILANWALIFGNLGAPEMGVRGAALASVGVQISTSSLLLAYAAWAPALRKFHLLQRFWRPDWPAFVQVARVGLPIGLASVSEAGLFQASALMMGWIGTEQLAAHGIALELASLTFMVHMGLSNAATVRVGRARGARDGARLRDGALVAQLMSLVFGGVTVVLFLSQPELLIGLFLDMSNPAAPAILAFGAKLMVVAALFQMFDSLQVMALGLLRGVQDTRVPMWIAVASYWLVGIPASYVLAFPLGFGGVGLWLGLVIGLACAGGFLILRFWRGPWLRAA
ncbi:MAG: MATE family efflux transporter [Paracoccaceae bacterium]|jgi:MATE family multidrug resistance protein|nr:MATE family efflux transporter [Paracoccaceae bacterium]